MNVKLFDDWNAAFLDENAFVREHFILIKIFIDKGIELLYSKCTEETLGILGIEGKK